MARPHTHDGDINVCTNDDDAVVTPKVVVIDPDSGVVTGPFDSKEEAQAYFIAMANQEGWADTLELIEKTGKPFVEKQDPFVFINSRSENLQLVELDDPSPATRSKITY